MHQAAPTPTWASPMAIVRILVVILVVIVAVWLLYLLRGPLGWIFLALFLSVALSGPVAWFSKYLPRGAAIAVTYLITFLTPIALLLAILPGVVNGVDGLIEGAPQMAADAQEFVQGNDLIARLETEYNIVSTLKERLSDLPAMLGDVASWLSSLGLGIVNSGFAVINIILLSIFMMAGGPRWSRAFLARRPAEQAERLERVFAGIGTTVGSYVMGALGQALIAGVTTYIVLVILDVPFAVGLAAITFLLDLIPLVGATIAGVLVGIMTLFSGFPETTIIWAIWAIAYQQIENNLIQPQIQRRAVAIEPIVVLISVLCGATLAGVLGAVLAIPVAASAQLVIREWQAYSAELAGEGPSDSTGDGSDDSSATGASAVGAAPGDDVSPSPAG